MFNFLDMLLKYFWIIICQHVLKRAEVKRETSVKFGILCCCCFSTNNSKTLLLSKGILLPTKINQSTKASTLSEERAPTEWRQLPDTKLTSLHKGPAFSNHIQTHKTFKLTKHPKECLFIVTQSHNLHIFRVIPFVMLQNDT